jgi:hypothetical protein
MVPGRRRHDRLTGRQRQVGRGRIVPARRDLPTDLYKRVEAFRPLMEVVIESPVDFDSCMEAVLDRGLQVMLTDVIGTTEPGILLGSINELARRHPETIYGFVAELMAAGAAIERERARKRIGFGPPEEA